MNGFVREARIKLNAAKGIDNEKVEMKEVDFNKLVSNIGKDLCLGKKGCLEYRTCNECCKDTLLSYIKII